MRVSTGPGSCGEHALQLRQTSNAASQVTARALQHERTMPRTVMGGAHPLFQSVRLLEPVQLLQPAVKRENSER